MLRLRYNDKLYMENASKEIYYSKLHVFSMSKQDTIF